MPKFEFTGADPIDHQVHGRVNPGDVVTFDKAPAGPWKPSRKRTTEPDSDDSHTEEA